MVCQECGMRARRDLENEVACRGVHETPAKPARCPRGHGLMVRLDGHDPYGRNLKEPINATVGDQARG